MLIFTREKSYKDKILNCSNGEYIIMFIFESPVYFLTFTEEIKKKEIKKRKYKGECCKKECWIKIDGETALIKKVIEITKIKA